MNTLPRFADAVIEPSKLRYVLDDVHPVGKHKARVMKAALGLEHGSERILERMIRDGISVHPATLRQTFLDGTERWVVEWAVLGRIGPMRFVTAWERRKHRPPRLVSCYLKEARR
ncbi:MAG: hypothetical protein FDZ75_03725 [Actinobacteria bacterium]|nr:MAG: hypothetical protein FDZ75_03725 [Actinomycetota bacterium]